MVSMLFVSCKMNSKVSNKNDISLFASNYQCIFYYDSTLKYDVYTSVDSMPTYKGGSYQLAIDITKNIDLKKMKIFQPSVVLEFIVDIDGSIVNSKILNKKNDELSEIEIECLESLKHLSLWKPGKCNHRIVPVKLKERIRFSPTK